MPSPNRKRHTDLLGRQIDSILKHIGVSQGKFIRDTGLADMTARRILDGEMDGDIPLWINFVLTLYIIDEEARTTKEPLRVPLEDYGIKI